MLREEQLKEEQLKEKQLKDELSRITNATDQEVLSKIDDNNLAINIRQETIDQLLDKFLSNATESTKKLVEKKISTIEEEIVNIKKEIIRLRNDTFNNKKN